jgi:hypothetical protein
MTVRKPLVINDGAKEVIQSGDYVDPSTLGSGSASAATALLGDNTWSRLRRFTVLDVPPTSPTPFNGDEWLCLENGKLYTYITDVDSSQWVELRSDTGDIYNVGLTMPVVNPTFPKDGDYRIISGVVDFYVGGVWRQIYPAVYS